MQIMWRLLWQGLVTLGLTLFVYQHIFGPGIPLTHDGPIHTVRMASYYLALQQGQIPPRIGPNMANGLGYPVFNYNYPLANIAAAGLIKMHLSYPTVYQLVVFGFIWIGTLGIMFLLSQLRFKGRFQLLGAVLYLANPFLLSQVFVRGGVGEIAFIALFPWVLWSITRLLTGSKNLYRRQLSLGIWGGMLALTHNVLVVFCLPILIIYCVWLSRKNWQRLFRLILPILLTFLLSAFFWLPALLEKSLVILDDAPITLLFAQHFLYFQQLISGSWSYGFSRPGPVDGLSFNLSLTELLLLTVITGTISFWRKNVSILLLWIGTLICFGLTLIQTFPIWQLFPYSFYIQFPWRLLWFGHFCLLMLAIFWARNMQLSKKWIVIISLLSLLIVSKLALPQSRTNRTQEEWLRAGETTSTMNENLPKTADLDKAYEVVDNEFKDLLVWTSTSSAQTKILSWDGTKRQYEITTNEPLTVVERTFYFPGWETRVNGELVTSGSHDPWNVGLLSYSLPSGNNQVTTRFSQHTFPRQLGNYLTLSGLIIISIWFIKDNILPHSYKIGKDNKKRINKL